MPMQFSDDVTKQVNIQETLKAADANQRWGDVWVANPTRWNCLNHDQRPDHYNHRSGGITFCTKEHRAV